MAPEQSEVGAGAGEDVGDLEPAGGALGLLLEGAREADAHQAAVGFEVVADVLQEAVRTAVTS